MYALRIRGIYTTALTNLFCKHGFAIVQPSRPICERFNFNPNQQPYDLDICDLKDSQGIFASGNPRGMEQLIRILQGELPDVIVRRCQLGLYAVYRGLTRPGGREGTSVDLGEATGLLPEEKLPDGEAVTVQVAELPARGEAPLLRRMIGIPGRYAILVSSGRIAVSRKIADYGERMRLSWLGGELAPKGWGIVWHTAAAGKPRSVIAKDLGQLATRARQLEDRAASEPPALLLGGEQAVHVEFPGGAKRRLDELRGEVIPTASGHHQAKASGREAGLDTLEEMVGRLSRSPEKDPAAGLLDFPKQHAKLAVEHVKLDGSIQILGRGLVTHTAEAEGVIQLEREIQTEGTYDGLGVAKEPGDRALTEFGEGRWWYRTSYYSPSGELKGEYYNVNTPVEIYSDRIRYIDLEIDIVRLPGGERRLIDEEKLEELQEGLISKELAESARRVAQALLEGSEKDELRDGL